ncbi:RsmE family RNA methyltransferase [Halobacteriovorax sp. JY17]|uniref:RsmE family RNA methyltransferase n=1 Tax=Halobacteriovorax sp. JY17 TaxID=2014617 RepID=UPI000C582F07|nr:RsmE family RNA methyltransferase [Halobacteriovorax sp. JY17]PIK13875.1 MAG: hypothetical protein CES88_12885 [Halobacteriovorax sp. JY17]
MNSICFFKEEIIDQSKIIFNDEKRLGHIHNHLKSKVSDEVTITILDQGIYRATILELSHHNCTIEFKEAVQSSEPWFHLLVGLSRPQTIKKVLEHSSTLGAASFELFKAQLSEKSYSQSKIYENLNFRQYLIDGLSQSKLYYNLPSFSLTNYMSLEKYLTHENKYFLSLNGIKTFNQLEASKRSNPLLAVGPERGWTKQEESKLIESGFKPIRISASTLRVEHAIYTAIGQLEMLNL